MRRRKNCDIASRNTFIKLHWLWGARTRSGVCTSAKRRSTSSCDIPYQMTRYSCGRNFRQKSPRSCEVGIWPLKNSNRKPCTPTHIDQVFCLSMYIGWSFEISNRIARPRIIEVEGGGYMLPDIIIWTERAEIINRRNSAKHTVAGNTHNLVLCSNY